MNSSIIEKIYTIAKRRYDDSLEPLHPCERPGERVDNDWFKVKCLAEILLEEARVDVNKRHIVQEIKAIANFEHPYNTYNSSWGLVLEYCKQLLEGEKQ